MTEGWPDFWMRGKKIDLIDLVDIINLIKQINTISTVNNLGTLDTLKTIETIQKINPQTIDSTEYNAVLDLIKKIQQIDNITSLDTLNAINTVSTIQKINAIHYLPTGILQNGSFETGELYPWYVRFGSAEVVSPGDEDNYCLKLPGGETASAVNQIIPPYKGNDLLIMFSAKADVDGDYARVLVVYTDATSEELSVELHTWFEGHLFKPTSDKRVAHISLRSKAGNAGAIYFDHVFVVKKMKVYQAEKDRTITNFPTEYPLPSSQLADLKNVNVQREGAVVHFSKSFSASGSSDIALPASGKALRILAWNLYCDADVVCELRFKNSGNVIAGLPAKGATAMNLIGCTAPTGDTDEPIEIYVSGAANVKGWVCVEET